MKLVNTPIKCVTDKDAAGRWMYCILCHITGKVVMYRQLKKHLKSINMTYSDYLKSFNSIEYLGKCEFCDREVVIRTINSINRVCENNLRFKNVIYRTCLEKECTKKMNNIRNYETLNSKTIDGKTLNELKIERMVETKHRLNVFDSARVKAIRTMKSRIDENGVSDFSKSRSLSNLNAAANGNLPTFRKRFITCKITGNEIGFNSLTEIQFYSRYPRLLNKFYHREYPVCKYELDSVTRTYICDYKLKDEYLETNLPYVIEVKNGNLTKSFKRDGSLDPLKNYLKFKCLLDLGKTVLVADYSKTDKFIMIDSHDKLEDVFKNVEKVQRLCKSYSE